MVSLIRLTWEIEEVTGIPAQRSLTGRRTSPEPKRIIKPGSGMKGSPINLSSAIIY